MICDYYECINHATVQSSYMSEEHRSNDLVCSLFTEYEQDLFMKFTIVGKYGHAQ